MLFVPRVPASETGAMGKVKDGVPASKALKASKGGSTGGTRARIGQFLANLGRVGLYKPMQGRYARIYTAVGLGVIVVLGLYQLYESLKDATTAVWFGVPT